GAFQRRPGGGARRTERTPLQPAARGRDNPSRRPYGSAGGRARASAARTQDRVYRRHDAARGARGDRPSRGRPDPRRDLGRGIGGEGEQVWALLLEAGGDDREGSRGRTPRPDAREAALRGLSDDDGGCEEGLRKRAGSRGLHGDRSPISGVRPLARVHPSTPLSSDNDSGPHGIPAISAFASWTKRPITTRTRSA